jgi:RNA polymerase sigma factor (sigma-70 family)
MEDCGTVEAYEELLGDEQDVQESHLPTEDINTLKAVETAIQDETENAENASDLVQALSKYRKSLYARNNKISGLMRNSVDTLAVMYKKAETPEDRATLLEALYMKFIFVLVSELRKKHSVSRALFNDAIQNISVRLLRALGKFDPNKSKSLAHYNLGYFMSGVSDTFAGSKVITVHRIKRRGSKKRYVPEVQVDYPVSTTFFEDMTTGDVDVYNSSDEVLDYIEHKEWRAYLHMALDPKNNVLTDLESQVLKRYFGIGDYEESSYREISEESNGSSCSRICQIQKKALMKVRRFFACNGVKPEL